MKICMSLFFSLLVIAGCKKEEVKSDSVDTESPAVVFENCGGMIGDHPCNFTFSDQNGDEWTLYENIGDVLVLEFATAWCGYCQISAQTVQPTHSLYESQGFQWVTILVENIEGEDPTIDDVISWADTYGITSAPVLEGDRSVIDTTGQDGFPITAWPMFFIIDRDMVIKNGLRGWSEEMVVGWVEDEISTQ